MTTPRQVTPGLPSAYEAQHLDGLHAPDPAELRLLAFRIGWYAGARHALGEAAAGLRQVPVSTAVGRAVVRNVADQLDARAETLGE